jgi:sterol 24-C-methyltransferase
MNNSGWTHQLLEGVLAGGSLPSGPTLLAAAASTIGAGILAVQLFTETDPLGKWSRLFRQLHVHVRFFVCDCSLLLRWTCKAVVSPIAVSRQESNLTSGASVHDSIHEYTGLHASDDSKVRQSKYKALVNAYYDLATVFYEWGWGSSFHFAVRFGRKTGAGESFSEAIRRHEYQLASWLVTPAAAAASASAANASSSRPHILDVGCGIGGPMRNIARFFSRQVEITGITLNEYQVHRGNEISAEQRLSDVCRSVQGDFMKLPFDDAALDGAYAIEATCHAPDRVACYREILRVIKPGCVFACYEWCTTVAYDPANPEHLRLKKDIEIGNGLPDIITTSECLQAMKDAGFEIVHDHDVAKIAHGEGSQSMDPWETPLTPSWNPLSQRFQFNWLGTPLTNGAIRLMEWTRIAPAGTCKTHKVLQTAGFGLRDAGVAGIFTTMYLIVARKPAN